MTKHIGILTAGGDSPGLNAAIRGAGKAGQLNYDMRIIGFKDGFRGLVENRTMSLEGSALSGVLTVGGTILGTTNKGDPFDYPLPDGSRANRAAEVIEGYRQLGLDALIGIGGDGIAHMGGEGQPLRAALSGRLEVDGDEGGVLDSDSHLLDRRHQHQRTGEIGSDHE